jgi:hypothetical protein
MFEACEGEGDASLARYMAAHSRAESNASYDAIVKKIVLLLRWLTLQLMNVNLTGVDDVEMYSR